MPTPTKTKKPNTQSAEVCQQECQANTDCDFWVYFDNHPVGATGSGNPKLKDCYMVHKTQYLGTETLITWCAPNEGTECIISGPKNCGDPKLGT